ncbi:MAG TPA: SBBP repeat-containing protein [candidate division Zixibacteria bacterium]|nr:SBBP repeat-containing protein [candidate division Zixibacteria bacterium]
MLIKKYLLILFILFISLPALAQVDTVWVRRYNGPGNAEDRVRALAVDNSGNVYITGRSIGSGTSFDYTTIKYSPGGDTIWVRRYNGTGNNLDEPFTIKVDTAGNVYIAGRSYGGGTFFDYATIKYGPTGDTLWVRRYNGTGNALDRANALAVDKNGNVYVTGESWRGTSSDYATIKYSPNGEIIWTRYYDGPATGEDRAYALTVDDSGNVYVSGESIGNGSFYDYATIKYDSNGNTLWLKRYNGTANEDDAAYALETDKNGNVYVTGISTGTGTYFDYVTIKYNNYGDTLWVKRYNGSGNYWDQPNFLTIDQAGNVYVTGSSYGNGTVEDYATLKYDPQGESLWTRIYNGPQNNSDLAFALAVDDSGYVYVTGCSDCYTPFGDYATICYSPTGDSLWIQRYDGTADSTDIASALVLDGIGNLYVAGTSIGSGTSYDFVTIKYAVIQNLCLAKPGDANGDSNLGLSDIITIVNYLFKGQTAPFPLCRGDVNADEKILLSDIIYLVNYLFKSGPAPLKSKECCL